MTRYAYGELVRAPESSPRSLADAQQRICNLTEEVGRLLGEIADLEAQNYHLQLEADALR